MTLSPLRVFLDPVGMYSRAMVRIANSLRRHRPSYVRIVSTPDEADLVVMYVISTDAISYAAELAARGQRYVAVQCCLQTAGGDPHRDWSAFWHHAALVWSYYDLSAYASEVGFRFYHSPLGLDDAFVAIPELPTPKRRRVITSGFVSGPGAEPIEDVWRAARSCNLDIVHIGPLPTQIAGILDPDLWARCVKSLQPNDTKLATLIRQSTWVAAMRHVEGFELPAAEALACGTMPILFDQPTIRRWYGDMAVTVPECSGDQLTQLLMFLFLNESQNNYQHASVVSDHTRRMAITRFDWSAIVNAFWHRLLSPHRDLRRAADEIEFDDIEGEV